MTDDDDIDRIAAEYVLGTLDAAERAAVAARRGREPALDTAITAWEARLAPLNRLAGEAEPPADLLSRIEARLDVRQGRGGDVIALRRQVTRWRVAAVAAGAMAASLAGVMIQDRARLAPSERFVAVFQQDDQQPSFLMLVDMAKREVTVRPVTAQAQAGKSYQLWIVARELGPRPRSLGLLDSATSPTRKALTEFDPALLEGATFGISLEPEGGSPTGQPTGPAIHGRLYPTQL